MAAFGEADEDGITVKPQKKLWSQSTRTIRQGFWNDEKLKAEDDYNPADPSSTNSPDSYIRRQEFLAKVSAAAGGMYIS
jgi:hypothetical protein